MSVSIFKYMEKDATTGERTRTVWRVKYIDPSSGNRRTKQFTTKARANAFSKTIERYEGVVGYDPATMDELFEDYIDTITHGLDGGKEREPTTIKRYREQWVTHIKPRIGVASALMMTKRNVVSLRTELLQDTSISRETARRAFNLVKYILKWANNEDRIPSDPSAGLGISKLSKHILTVDDDDTDKDVKTHGPEGMQMIVETANRLVNEPGRRRHHWDRVLHALAFTYIFTGMRSSEVLGLTRDAVRLEEGRIRVRQKARPDGTIGPVKSVHSRREVPILPSLRVVLEAYIERGGFKSDDLLFATRTGNPLTYQNVLKRMWYVLQELSGLEKLGLHATRHFYGSAIIATGGRPHLAQKLLGHHSPAFTMEVYAHLFMSEEELALNTEAHKFTGEFQVSVPIMDEFKALSYKGN